MKNYFKKPDTNLYIMIDDVLNNVLYVNNATNMKNIIITSDVGAYSTYVTQSSDNTKWVSVDEETFNSIVTTIKLMF